MKVLLENSCCIEDRRVETSKGKKSLIVQETCGHCKKVFVYIVAEADASLVSDLCSKCSDKQLKLYVYDSIGVLERHTVWNVTEAEEVLRNTATGRNAVLRNTEEIRVLKTWRFEDAYWQVVTNTYMY